MVLTKEDCPTCFNYWRAHGDYNAGWLLLIRDKHIPEAHASRPSTTTHTSTGPSVADLRNQLNSANSRATGLQNQLNTANSQNGNLQTQVNNANTQIRDLSSQLAAANARANDLQRQLDDSRKANKILADEVAQLKTDKGNLENMNKRLLDEMNKKDAETLQFQADKLAAENKIAIQLEPYIQVLQSIITASGLTYPPAPP